MFMQMYPDRSRPIVCISIGLMLETRARKRDRKGFLGDRLKETLANWF